MFLQDVVILNKIDLISQEGSENALDKLEKEIREINALAHIIRSVRCQVDFTKILNCKAYDATVNNTEISLSYSSSSFYFFI